MKKLSVALTMLSSLFVLTGCNTNNETAEAPTQSSTSQSDASSSSSSQGSAESTSSATDSEEQSDTSNSSSMEESAESTSSTSENVINSEEEAFNFIKEETGIETDNTDIAYELLESDEDSYTLKLVSKSLQEQGGSGAAGIYKVYKDGTYEIVA
ncbi:hypothetical protein LHA31_01170 [Carnobacterium viridans]|uniref:Uncharacterized protein n=1 Tax=Carnobacterium viridans TaxID=174587 RepID=A0A1H0XZ43_9LACT|nr:hypothetical protein [Carnobacterium viridans]UDE95438.1 hypothetical protein LHA31_01170 [Carnobacterium viridans]SDQ08115.1 hypothetical protein SAMN04487752_0589 [Carnobacterium viridans]